MFSLLFYSVLAVFRSAFVFQHTVVMCSLTHISKRLLTYLLTYLSGFNLRVFAHRGNVSAQCRYFAELRRARAVFRHALRACHWLTRHADALLRRSLPATDRFFSLDDCPPFRGDICTPSHAWFPGPTRVTTPNGISISATVFCRAHERDQQTDRQTNRPRCSVCSNGPLSLVRLIIENKCISLQSQCLLAKSLRCC